MNKKDVTYTKVIGTFTKKQYDEICSRLEVIGFSFDKVFKPTKATGKTLVISDRSELVSTDLDRYAFTGPKTIDLDSENIVSKLDAFVALAASLKKDVYSPAEQILEAPGVIVVSNNEGPHLWRVLSGDDRAMYTGKYKASLLFAKKITQIDINLNQTRSLSTEEILKAFIAEKPVEKSIHSTIRDYIISSLTREHNSYIGLWGGIGNIDPIVPSDFKRMVAPRLRDHLPVFSLGFDMDLGKMFLETIKRPHRPKYTAEFIVETNYLGVRELEEIAEKLDYEGLFGCPPFVGTKNYCFSKGWLSISHYDPNVPVIKNWNKAMIEGLARMHSGKDFIEGEIIVGNRSKYFFKVKEVDGEVIMFDEKGGLPCNGSTQVSNVRKAALEEIVMLYGGSIKPIDFTKGGMFSGPAANSVEAQKESARFDPEIVIKGSDLSMSFQRTKEALKDLKDKINEPVFKDKKTHDLNRIKELTDKINYDLSQGVIVNDKLRDELNDLLVDYTDY